MQNGLLSKIFAGKIVIVCVVFFAASWITTYATAQTSASYLEASPAVSIASQGPYVTWNALTGGVGETDFLNNEGLGTGGFAFMNTPSSGSPVNTMMFISGQGNVGIGTASPGYLLDVSGAGGGGATVNTARFYANAAGPATAQLLFGTFSNQVNSGISGFTATGTAGSLIFSTAQGGTGTLTQRMAIDGNGYVGIGTTSPGSKLEVNGNVTLTSGSGGSITFADGTTQSTAYSGTCTATGGDYAESVDVIGDKSGYEPGDVIVIDAKNPGRFLLSSSPYSKLVAGIYSTKPGYVGRRQKGDPKLAAEIPMAMVGIVPTKVTAENGPIEAGDLLVTSSRAGYVMKGTDNSKIIGAVVGKALGSLDSGTGVIEVLVSLQ